MFKKISILLFGFFLICSRTNLVEAEETGDILKKNIEVNNTGENISGSQSVTEEALLTANQSDVQVNENTLSKEETTVPETDIQTNSQSEISKETLDEIISLSEGTNDVSMEMLSDSKIRTADYDEIAKQVVITSEDIEEVLDEPKNARLKGKSYTKSELRLLSALVYAEAGNQSYQGMLAVANIVLNRAESNVYSHVDTVKEVIYDKKWAVQFAVTVKSKSTGISPLDRALDLYDNGNFSGDKLSINEQSMKKAIKAAKAALEGENNIGNYLCFRVNSKSIQTSIASKYGSYKVIGSHIFYRVS